MLTVTCRDCGEKIVGLLDYEHHARGHAARSIHDDEVNVARERVASSWVMRAQAGELPAKEYAR